MFHTVLKMIRVISSDTNDPHTYPARFGCGEAQQIFRPKKIRPPIGYTDYPLGRSPEAGFNLCLQRLLSAVAHSNAKPGAHFLQRISKICIGGGQCKIVGQLLADCLQVVQIAVHLSQHGALRHQLAQLVRQKIE